MNLPLRFLKFLKLGQMIEKVIFIFECLCFCHSVVTFGMIFSRPSLAERYLIANTAVDDLLKPLNAWTKVPQESSISAISSICFNYPDSSKLKIPKQLLQSARTHGTAHLWICRKRWYLKQDLARHNQERRHTEWSHSVIRCVHTNGCLDQHLQISPQ